MSITNAKFAGRSLLLKVETSPGVFSTIGGCRSNSFAIANGQIDISDKDDDEWRKLLQGGQRTVSTTVAGLITNQTEFNLLRAAAQNNTALNCRINYASGLSIEGPFQASNLQVTGEYTDAQSFSVTLESMDTIYMGGASSAPTLDLDFTMGALTPTRGNGTPVFSRSSTATYRGVDGLIKTAGVDVARFEYDVYGNVMGYLPERQSTNVCLRSQEFDNGAWTKTTATATANAFTAPDGTLTADKLAETAVNAIHVFEQSVAKAASAQAYTFTVFLRAAERTAAQISIDDGAGNGYFCQYNLLTGAPVTLTVLGTGVSNGQTATYAYANGWWRIEIGMTTNAVASFRARIFTVSGGVTSYLGVVGNGMYVWGAQMENQQRCTSYIPTTSASVTRSQDALSYSVASITGFSTTAISMLVEGYEPWIASAGATSSYLAGLVAVPGTFVTAAANSHFMYLQNQTAAWAAIFVASVADGAVGSVITNTPNTLRKIAYAAQINDMYGGASNGTFVADASLPNVNLSIMTQLQVGFIGNDGGNSPDKPIKRLSYWNTRLPNADIQGLVS